MRHLARQALNVLMLVIAFSVSGMNGYASALAACPMHEHGAAHVHATDSQNEIGNGAAPSVHDHGAEIAVQHVHAGSDAATPDGDQPASGDGPCTHVHLHCCATFAVAAADYGLMIAVHDRAAAVPVGEAHVLLGQISSPLFRPPRASA
jgi:hypothetical protein